MGWAAEQFAARLAEGEAIAPAATRLLIQVIKDSEAATVLGLEIQLKEAVEDMETKVGISQVSFHAACDLFFWHLAQRSSLAQPGQSDSFDAAKRRMIASGESFAGSTQKSRQRIVQVAERFIRDGQTILTHGKSRVVGQVLTHASKSPHGKKFHVIVTETRPNADGFEAAARLRECGIPVTLVLDSAVAAVMEKVDMVLVGAEGISESGGLINKIGTANIALAAHAFNVPFYVATESYKFTRSFVIRQNDLPSGGREKSSSWATEGANGKGLSESDGGVTVAGYVSDLTPASRITLLLTDRGALTPAAVSAELIQVYELTETA